MRIARPAEDLGPADDDRRQTRGVHKVKAEALQPRQFRWGEPPMNARHAVNAASDMDRPRMPCHALPPVGKFRHHRRAEAVILHRVDPPMRKAWAPRAAALGVLNAVAHHAALRS